jgi:hypothetical protein
MKRPTLHTMYKGSMVRHLLILGDDPGAMKLTQITDGLMTVLAAGTKYEMDQQAMSLVQSWGKDEGFQYRNHSDPPVFESLNAIRVLLLEMGYTQVYDPKCKSLRNMIGSVPLAQWLGWIDKLGSPYEYGFTGTTVYGQPKITEKHGVNFRPETNQQFLEEMKKAVAIRKSLGPEQDFILG